MISVIQPYAAHFQIQRNPFFIPVQMPHFYLNLLFSSSHSRWRQLQKPFPIVFSHFQERETFQPHFLKVRWYQCFFVAHVRLFSGPQFFASVIFKSLVFIMFISISISFLCIHVDTFAPVEGSVSKIKKNFRGRLPSGPCPQKPSLKDSLRGTNRARLS